MTRVFSAPPATSTESGAMPVAGKNIKWTLSRPAKLPSSAKDGADLPPEQALTGPASLVIAPGETYDFKFRPEEESLQLSLEIVLLKEKLTQAISVGPEASK